MFGKGTMSALAGLLLQQVAGGAMLRSSKVNIACTMLNTVHSRFFDELCGMK